MGDIEKILAEREKTHGDFNVHSFIAQELKGCLREQKGWVLLNPQKREALEMICHKMARVLAGNSNHPDHWHDIAGYATLVAKSLERGEND